MLLPHYERELGLLRAPADEFVHENPGVAGRLSASGGIIEDPHVERMMQAFAFLSARIRKRLDDDYSLFTESFLAVVYPHYLRPFPACSIACFAKGESETALTEASVVPRGRSMLSDPVRSVRCTFVTTAEAQVLPLRLRSARFQGIASVPSGTRLPAGASGIVSLHFELSPEASWAELGADHLRLYIDGDTSLVRTVREALTSRVIGAMVQTEPEGRWLSEPDAVPRAVELGDDEPLIAFDARTHPAYRLLTEYFAFPQKFNFVDLPLPASVDAATSSSLWLHFVLEGLRGDSEEVRQLERVTAQNFVLGCAPMVNLFSTSATPVKLTNQTATFAGLPSKAMWPATKCMQSTRCTG